MLNNLKILNNNHTTLNIIIKNYQSNKILSLNSPTQHTIKTYTQHSNHIIIKPNYKNILIIQNNIKIQQKQLKQNLHTHHQKFKFHQKQIKQLYNLKKNLSSQKNNKLTKNFTILKKYKKLHIPPTQQNNTQSKNKYKLHQNTPLINKNLQQTHNNTTFTFNFSTLKKKTTKKPTNSHLTKKPNHFNTTKNSHLKP